MVITALILDSTPCTQGASGCSARKHTFEVYGFDFMIDTKHNAWLIEANLNPDMSHSTSITGEMVEEMIADSVAVVTDANDTGLVGKDAEESESEEEEESECDDEDGSEEEDVPTTRKSRNKAV